MISTFRALKNEFKESLKSSTVLKNWSANILTLSRGLAPLIVVPLVLTGHQKAGLITAAIFASTDFFDGYLARRFNNVSKLGEHLDQVCDKIFAISLLATSAIMNPIILINIFLELLIIIINLNSLKKGNNPKTSGIGKVKTCMLSITILVALLPEVNINVVMVLIPTILFQMVTIIDYKIKDLKKDQAKKINEAKQK